MILKVAIQFEIALDNQLVTLVVRKILGSSTFAVAQTLTAIIDRLKARKRPEVEDIPDIETADEIAEEWPAEESPQPAAEPPIDAAKLKAEVEELEGYLALARSIPVNAKGEQLVQVLPSLLNRIENELGGQRKAVIFTESVRTQKYLADLLAANGYAGQIALLNGQNDDIDSREIYAHWHKRQKENNSDAISGSKTADMKAAIKTDQASALINAARNIGGSIGISLVSNVLAHREQFHQSRLVESVIPSSVQYQNTLQQVTNYFVAQGSSLIQAQQQAIAWIGEQVQIQASFLAYMDAFWVLMLISLAAVPLALALRNVKLGGATHPAH